MAGIDLTTATRCSESGALVFDNPAAFEQARIRQDRERASLEQSAKMTDMQERINNLEKVF
jgi:hypothetical protein